jgi:hypothetical protein
MNNQNNQNNTMTKDLKWSDIDFNNERNRFSLESLFTLWWNLTQSRGVNSHAYAEITKEHDEFRVVFKRLREPLEKQTSGFGSRGNVPARGEFIQMGAFSGGRQSIVGNSIEELVQSFSSRLSSKITPEMFQQYVQLLHDEYDIIRIQNCKAFENINDGVLDFTEKVGAEWFRSDNLKYGVCNDITDEVSYGYGEIDGNGFWLFPIPHRVMHEGVAGNTGAHTNASKVTQ